MLKRWRGRLACGLGGLLLSISPLVQAERLLLVGDEFCPYNCDDKGTHQGYMIDLLRHIYSGLGYEVEYRLVPWSRSIQMVSSGAADILIANTPENSPDPRLSTVLGVDSTCFFARQDSTWQFDDIDDLKAVRLGVIQDYHYDGKGPLDAYIRANIRDTSRVVSSKGARALHTNFKMLQAGRLDVLLENCNVGSWLIKDQSLSDEVFIVGRLPTYHGDLQVSFSPHDPRSGTRQQQLIDGMLQLRARNELQPILDKYNVSDWLAKPAAEPENP